MELLDDLMTPVPSFRYGMDHVAFSLANHSLVSEKPMELRFSAWDDEAKREYEVHALWYKRGFPLHHQSPFFADHVLNQTELLVRCVQTKGASDISSSLGQPPDGELLTSRTP